MLEIRQFMTEELQGGIARHHAAWAPDRFDFGAYLSQSTLRYEQAIDLMDLRVGRPKELLDVGGLWGAFPLSLVRCGCDAAMTEAMVYYDGRFDPLFTFLREQGVEIVDFDPFDAASPAIDVAYNNVSLLAVLEHYPHSLRTCFGNLESLVATSGSLCIEVPNIAYWYKRLQLLRGVSPLPDIEDILDSEVPFTGHHHEFTAAELDRLLERMGWRVTSRTFYNYSMAHSRHPVWLLASWLAGVISHRSREVMMYRAVRDQSRGIMGCTAADVLEG